MSVALSTAASPVGDHLRAWRRSAAHGASSTWPARREISSRRPQLLVETGRANLPKPGHGSAPGRAAGSADARAKRAAGRRRLCAGVPGERPRRSGADGGARGGRDHPRGPQALSGVCARPALEHRRQQQRPAAAVRRRRSGAAVTAGQCDATVAASGRARAADHQPGRVAWPCAGAAAPPDRTHCRPGADRPVG